MLVRDAGEPQSLARSYLRSRRGVAVVQFDQKINKEETHRSMARPLCAYVLTPPLGISSE